MKKIAFQEVKVNGTRALLCESRGVAHSPDIDEFPHRYYLRGSDNDFGRPATAEARPVLVNFCGVIFTAKPLRMKKGSDFAAIRSINYL